MKISVRNTIVSAFLCVTSVAFSSTEGADVANVYLFAGQSNMWGTGNKPEDLPPELAAVDEGVRVLVLKGTPAAGESVPLQNGVNNNWSPGAWGSEAQLMHRLSTIATDKPIYMLKVSAGGTWLMPRPDTEQTDWSPRSSNELLDAFIGDITKAKASLEAAGKQARFPAFIWMQGESDSNDLAAATAYKDDLATLIARVREAASEPEMKVYVGRIHRHYSGPFLNELRASQARLAEEGRNIVLFDTDSFALHTDKIHYAPAGQIEIGNAIFDLITGTNKPVASEVAAGQSFTVRAYAGAGTLVGTVAMTTPGLPAPTFVINHPAFVIDAETGVLRVKDLTAVDYTATPEMKLTVSAVNGASPTGASEIVVRFDATEDAENAIAGRYMVIDPDSAESGTVTDSAYTDVYDAAFPARKFTAERPPIQDLLPGSTRMAMRFDGAQVMIGPRTSDFVTPGTDEDLTLAMAVHVAPSDRKDVGWCIVINKGDTQPGIGVGYDYAASQFVFAYANSFNGAVQMGRTTERFETGVSRVVRLRKVGESLRLYIDGKLAAEETGKGVRKVILAANEGAPMGLGGMFRPAPSLVGSMGKIYIVKGILTTREESHIDNDLADWAQVSIKSN